MEKKLQTTEKNAFVEQATDQLALLFFQLIVNKAKAKTARKNKRSKLSEKSNGKSNHGRKNTSA